MRKIENMSEKQVAEAVERLSYAASCPEERWLSGPQDTSASGVVVKRADLNTTLSALAEARSEAEKLNKIASNDMTALDLMTGWNEANKRIRSLLAERDTLTAQLVGAREALEELDERIATALACQEQDVKVNGARHPGLLEPMRGILRDLAARSRQALSTSPAPDAKKEIV